MCCCHNSHLHHGPRMFGHMGCCCCDEPHFRRRFISKAEVIRHLEEYLEELKMEIKGVEETIADLKKRR